MPRTEAAKKWWREHPEKVREYKRKSYTPEARRRRQLRQLYGITLEDYNKMLDEQGGRCLVCRSETELHVDHDHKTGVVRGLLCTKCNTGLGLFCDSPELLDAAASYLRRF